MLFPALMLSRRFALSKLGKDKIDSEVLTKRVSKGEKKHDKKNNNNKKQKKKSNNNNNNNNNNHKFKLTVKVSV